jgi:hypothetical protein
VESNPFIAIIGGGFARRRWRAKLCPVIAVEAMVQKRLGSVGEGE